MEQAEKVRALITTEKEMLGVTQEKFLNLDSNIKGSVDEQNVTQVSDNAETMNRLASELQGAVPHFK